MGGKGSKPPPPSVTSGSTNMNSKFQYDLLVVGGGPGGLAAAKQVSQAGYKVALAEKDAVGGTCVLRGCIPEKLLSLAAKFAEEAADAAGLGWQVGPRGGERNGAERSGAARASSGTVRFDWAEFVRAQEAETRRLSESHAHALRKAGVELVHGAATFLDPHTLRLGGGGGTAKDGGDKDDKDKEEGPAAAGRVVTARTVLLAVGAVPVLPDVPGVEHIIIGGDLFFLPRQPRRLAVVGGDYIAVKLAGIMCALGSQVMQVVAEASVLANYEAELVEAVAEGARKRGLWVLTRAQLKAVRRRPGPLADAAGTDGGVLEMVLEQQEQDAETGNNNNSRTKEVVVEVDAVLDGTYRRPNIAGLGLDKAGVAVADPADGGAVVVDDYSRTTSTGNVFAVGDCVSSSWQQFTPLAIAQARAFADTQFGPPGAPPYAVCKEHVPAHVSAFPAAATVGLSEARARQKYGKSVRGYSSKFSPLAHGLTGRDEKVVVKLVVDTASDRVLGAHMVGEGAVDIVQCLALALRLGARKRDFDDAIGIHPSVAEEFFSMRSSCMIGGKS